MAEHSEGPLIKQEMLKFLLSVFIATEAGLWLRLESCVNSSGWVPLSESVAASDQQWWKLKGKMRLFLTARLVIRSRPSS